MNVFVFGCSIRALEDPTAVGHIIFRFLLIMTHDWWWAADSLSEIVLEAWDAQMNDSWSVPLRSWLVPASRLSAAGS